MASGDEKNGETMVGKGRLGGFECFFQGGGVIPQPLFLFCPFCFGLFSFWFCNCMHIWIGLGYMVDGGWVVGWGDIWDHKLT